MRSAAEVAARLARQHKQHFTGPHKKKALRVSVEAFYLIAERKQLRDAMYDDTARWLLQDHDLILGRGRDYFLLIPTSMAEREWPLMPLGAAKQETRREAPAVGKPLVSQTTLNPIAAWPYLRCYK